MISVIVTCMGRLHHIQQTMHLLCVQKDAEIILVDYSDPDRSGDWTEKNFPRVRVVRVLGEKLFSMSKARNAGAQAAMTDWLVFLDGDALIHPRFSQLIHSKLAPGVYLKHPLADEKGYNGFVVCAREDWKTIGGYDERCKDWGFDDTEFYARLDELGRKRVLLPHDIFRAIDHSDDERTKHFIEKNICQSWRRNANLPTREIKKP